MQDSLVGNYNSKSDFYYEQDRPEMLDYIPANIQKVLDVGCSSGAFGSALKTERLVECWGVETNQNAAAIAATRLDRVIAQPFEEGLELPEHYFDCIIFNDVLEHLVDPYTALAYSKKLLSPSGVIVASIPNVRYFGNIWKLLVKKDWKYTEYGILDWTHLRFFTQLSIRRMFEDGGYLIQSIDGINPVEQQHPEHRHKFNALNAFLLNQIEDMRYLQFAVVASLND
jgi:SAM-dependent methyltransferase